MRKRHRSRAQGRGRRGMLPLEPLEGRVLMATAKEVFNVGNIDTSNPTSTAVTNMKDGPMSNVGANLLNLYLDYRKFRSAGGKDADYVAPARFGLWTTGSKVGVTVRGLVPLATLTEKIRSYGGGILYRTGTFNAIDAVVPITMLHAIAIDPSIASVNPITKVQTANAGSSNNQANETQVADLVRSTFGVTGVGVKIGVISTSVNLVGNGISGSIATGDLPASGVQVLTDSTALLDTTGTLNQDEGRAMLELIHDIAPDAELAFATGIGGQQIFADAIRALRAAGCDIIVDDLVYLAEPFFQPGVIDQAITDVVADGAIYVSSAGNFAESGYEAPVTFTPGPGIQLVDWDAGPATDTRLRFEIDVPGTLFLQWDNPYNGIAGNVSTDLDMYAFDPDVPSRIRSSSTLNNLRNGVPVEAMALGVGRYDLQVRVADTVEGKPLPTRLKMVLIPDGAAVPSSMFVEYPGIRASIFGHSGHTDTISVGAVPFFDAPPYSGASPISSEGFTSAGPVTQVFDASGNRHATPKSILKPDISGVDGTNTSFFTGTPITPLPGEGDILQDGDVLPNFFGTSAAAPNIAGSLALIRQAAPGASLNELLEVLKQTAIPLNGSTAGQHDPRGGYGLINTFSAIEPFVQAPTVESITANAEPAYGEITSITVVFSQQVSGFTVDDLRFTFGDELNNRLTGDNQPVTNDGGRTWIIPNINVITNQLGPGTYTLALDDTEGDIVNPIGLHLVGGAIKSFVLFPIPDVPTPPSAVATKVLSSTSVRIRWSDNSGAFEEGFEIERSESANFTSRVTRFTVPRNTVVFTDTGANLAGKTLYYRVRAFNVFAEYSAFSTPASVTTPSPGEIILDNESSSGISIVGAWDVADDVPGFLGSSFLDDLNAGKGTNKVTFTPNLQSAGDYFVYVRWTRAVDRATNVPIDVGSNSGKKTFTVNQRDTGGSGWVLLGKFNFKAGRNGYLAVRTDGTNGKVIVDAVRFLPAG